MDKIPVFNIEEHHEAFYIWHLAKDRAYIRPSGNILLHVDHHDDMEFNGYTQRFLDSLSGMTVQESKVFTYHELGIANFIIPALYEGIFEKFYLHKGLTCQEFRKENKFIQRRNSMELIHGRYIPFIHSPFKENPEYTFYTYYEGALSEMEDKQDIVLDIDLDYFWWDDSLTSVGEKKIEITKEAYEEYMENEYHPFRILPVLMVRAVEQNGRYYLDYKEYREPDRVPGKELVKKRIQHFIKWLSQQKIYPSVIDICHSRKSGYLPREADPFVEEYLLEGLNEIYSLEFVTQ